ncbi:ferritin-like domain-containing protein [Terriglobus aquaticus]|uniref:Ferritin-like domain-containing protein n=1 Tax=Terriglobus aquaticus TaxID=940139 RepID=A0ABW9KNT0_9BACT|nr:ferritin-like domain-containing protein [Terriglobus aquaticus]
MATTETKMLDSIIASRRAVLLGAGALAATAALGGEKKAAAAVPATLNDTQILNFALNLEYLEAQFYTLATEGVTADKSANKPISLGGSTAGAVTVKANPKVPFVNTAVQSYGLEIALEERNHVTFLQGALGTAAVAQPAINLQSSFVTLGSLAGVPNYDPFANDLYFLLGSYIFEDVGVTAYHGGALAISKTNLTAAAGIHAVEAYHAGIVRTLLTQVDQGLVTVGGGGQGVALSVANAISNVRATVDGTLGKLPTDAPGLTGQDDFGINYKITAPLNGVGGPYLTSNIDDEGKLTAANATTYTYSNYVCFGRTPQQVLDIVYASASGAKGGFFPNGLNGDIS